MRQTIIAKRYAKALFAVGKETENKREYSLGLYNREYSLGLNDLAGLLKAQPEIMDALTNPVYPLDIRKKVMGHLISAMGADQIMSNFLNLLVQKKRTGALPEIALEFRALVDAEQNVCRGEVVSATALDAATQAKIQTKLEKLTGKQVILSTQVDPTIIGGIIAKIGDLVLDGSIKTQLAGLKESIKGSE